MEGGGQKADSIPLCQPNVIRISSLNKDYYDALRRMPNRFLASKVDYTYDLFLGDLRGHVSFF